MIRFLHRSHLLMGRLPACWLGAGILLSVAASSCSAADGPDFFREVRPILAKACFQCHGPDEETREAELRLDQPTGLFGTIDGHAIVAKGDVQHSELIRRILSTDADEQMPPADSGRSLTESQKQTLVRWVESGAPWEQHWAFVAPQRPLVPDVTASPFAGWATNEIDSFILMKQAAAGLTPSPMAEPEILVRRMFLDLIGLPPTIEEAEHWIQKLKVPTGSGVTGSGKIQGTATTLNASSCEELVDHLLDRPEYGERWARTWLDLARYADTNGYEKDRPRSIWPYRDWVIQSLNDDMPFDQFTIEQIAGDMLPDATRSQKIATGFHRNTMLNEEGGIDPLEFRFHAMTDRVATTGTTWLGLTIGCAQCHTHKYDPLSHREYYQFMAFLNNADEPSLALPDSGADELLKARLEEASRLLDELPSHWPLPVGRELSQPAAEQQRSETVQKKFAEWLTDERRTAVSWRTLTPASATANMPHLTMLPDGSILATGDTTKQDRYEVHLAASDDKITAIRLEALPDERLPGNGPGTTYYEGSLGDFYLNELSVNAGDEPVKLRSATESYAKNKFGNTPVSAALTLDGDVQTGWSVANAEGQRHTAVYVLEQPVPAGTPLTIQMIFGRHFASSLGRFRFSAANSEREPAAKRLSDFEEHLLAREDAELNDSDRQQLFHAFLLTAPELSAMAEKVRQLQSPLDVTTTLVLQERPDDNPRPTFRHHRGEYLQPREQVTASSPDLLQAWPDDRPRNRLGFAKWLVDRTNPLTARVIVNRQWAALFGRGIVATVDDFGIQGTPPTHPELLDWLAVSFMDDDHWSLKKMHRRMVLSSTYRQSAVRREQSAAIDPENSLLSFAPRFRLDAEVVRDSIVQAAGVLSKKRGGPPVRPLQPAGITEVAFGSPKWDVSSADDRYRRSIYTFIKRTAPFAMVTTFDGLSGESCVARRNRSNTPLQALTLLNDPMFMDLAQVSGRNLMSGKVATDKERITHLFRRMLTRSPDAEELSMLSEFVVRHREQFNTHPEQAARIAGTSTEPSTDPSPAEQATWTALSRAVFGLDEVVMRP